MSSGSELSEHARRNRSYWDRDAPEWVEPGREAWASDEPRWGIWGVPESELRVLADVEATEVLEVGCGTAYWSGWLARRGARAVGLDNSEKQLETARRFQGEFGLEFPLVHASAEALPLSDESFDLVLSEYGASIWADPYLWVPEAARVLRPGGRLVFLVNGTISILCAPDEDAPAGEWLLRDYFGMHRFEWPVGDPDGGGVVGEAIDSVEFHLGYGDWIRLLRANGFEVEDLIELRAPEGAPPNRFGFVTPEWARRWPSEEIWKARKSAPLAGTGPRRARPGSAGA